MGWLRGPCRLQGDSAWRRGAEVIGGILRPGGGHIVANPDGTATPKVRLAFAVTKVLYDSYYSPL